MRSLVVERAEQRKIKVALLTKDDVYLKIRYGSRKNAENRLHELNSIIGYDETSAIDDRESVSKEICFNDV